MNTKDWIQYSSAIVMLLSGATLTFISFFFRGDVTNNTLYYVAQCILYAAGIFGISIYAKTTIDKKIEELRSRWENKLNKEKADDDKRSSDSQD